MQLSERTSKASPLPALVDDPVALRIREKHAAKAAAKVLRNEQYESGEREKNLILERLPNGLYFVRFEAGGQLPDELKGKFTSIAKLTALIVKRYGKNILK